MGNLRVLVARRDIKTKGLYPSSLELYDLMHLTQCQHAIERWKEEWSFCPVCLARYEANGDILHIPRSKDTLS